MSQQGPHFSPHSKDEAKYKRTNLRITSDLSVVSFTTVNSEKTCLKKLMMNMIIKKLTGSLY